MLTGAKERLTPPKLLLKTKCLSAMTCRNWFQTCEMNNMHIYIVIIIKINVYIYLEIT